MISFKKFINESVDSETKEKLSGLHPELKKIYSDPNVTHKEVSNILLDKHGIDIPHVKLTNYFYYHKLGPKRQKSLKMGLGDEHINQIKGMLEKGAHHSVISDYIEKTTGKKPHPKNLESIMYRIHPRGHKARVYTKPSDHNDI